MNNKARRQNYIKQVLLNELLIGQGIDYIKSIKDNNLEMKYNIDFDNLYIAVLGVPREIYAGVYHQNATQYLWIFDKIRDYIKNEFESKKYKVEVFLNLYSDSRKIIVMITPKRKNHYDEVKELVVKANKYLNSLYFEKFENLKKEHLHIGSLSNHITSWQDIKSEFEKVDFCSYLSFFTDKLEVIDCESYYEILNPFSYIDLYKILKDIMRNVSQNNVEEISKLCDTLFLEYLKATFDSNLCTQILLKLKMEILDRNAFKVGDVSIIEKVLNETTYYKVEEMNQAVKELLINVSNQIKDYSKEYNAIITKALEYIHANYHKKVLLVDIAEYVEVVPQHLSKVFNKELATSVPIYVNSLRVEKAKKLLSCTEMKSSMISQKCGFESPRRFGQIFKEHSEMTPLEYRKNIKCDECQVI